MQRLLSGSNRPPERSSGRQFPSAAMARWRPSSARRGAQARLEGGLPRTDGMNPFILKQTAAAEGVPPH